MKFVALLIFVFSPLLANAGSWSSGGGGTGIACFDTEEAAQAVREEADFASRPELIQALTSVSMTDYAENSSDTFVEPLANESAHAYLNRVVESRLKYAPAFFRILRSSLDRVQVSTVNTNETLQASNDTGGLRSWTTSRTSGDRTSVPMTIGPKCVLVQVALRTFVAGSGKQKSVSIRVNQILYSHLGDGSARLRTINQAVLMLHEALYLVASSLGQKTSLDTRVLTATLLANNRIDYFRQNARWVRSIDPSSVNPEGMLMQQELSIDGFAAAFAPAPSGKSNVLADALKSFQAKQQAIQEALNGIDTFSEEGQTIAMHFDDSLSGPEVLMVVSSLALQRGRISGIDSVVNPEAADHDASLRTVCQIARNFHVAGAATAVGPDRPAFKAQALASERMIRRAAAYCAQEKL